MKKKNHALVEDIEAAPAEANGAYSTSFYLGQKQTLTLKSGESKLVKLSRT
jgi:hypothetical protein